MPRSRKGKLTVLSIPSNVKKTLTVREIAVFSVLGALMFCSKIIMEALPNIHLLGMLTIVYTIVFRTKALIPIYIYVAVNGLFSGFSVWWIPYLYIWTLLWGMTMLLPKRMPRAVAYWAYAVLCGFHGFAFGTLYAPAQAIMFRMNFEQTLAWIAAGIPFDLVHGIANIAVGLLILPLSDLLRKLTKRIA